MNSQTHYTARLPMFPVQAKQVSPPAAMEDSYNFPFPAERVSTSYLHRGTRRPYESSNDGVAAKARSQSIPIQSGMRRTASEQQLCEEHEMADFRDYLMFTRIVDGICKTQHETKDYKIKQENDLCLAHIIGTRNDSEASLADYRLPKSKASSQSLQEILASAIASDLDGYDYDHDLEDDAMFIIDL
jgi:hypothetical protein